MEDVLKESIARLAIELNALYDELGTWDKVGERYDVSRTIVWRIAKKGYEPTNKSPETRRKLGLPIIEMIPQIRNAKGRFAGHRE